MKNSNRFKIFFAVAAVVLVLGLVAGFIGFKIYTGNYYVADSVMIESIAAEVGDGVKSYSDDQGTVFIPADLSSVKAVIAYYPGGKVEYKAYSGLMYKLSARGYICVIPHMRGNLAFLNIDAIDDIWKRYADEMTLVDGVDWYLAGHSLGGVAAAKYLVRSQAGEGASGQAGDVIGISFKGLILCASYSVDDLHGKIPRLLSVVGSEDGVLKRESYEKYKVNWPDDAKEEIIEGGIHSYFGCYGIQDGDGRPEITVEEQLDETAEIIDAWISKEKGSE